MSLLLAALAISTIQLHREVTVEVAKDVAPSSKIQLNINTTNVRRVQVIAYPVNGEEWLAVQSAPHIRPQPIGPSAAKWTVTVAEKGQKPNPRQADTYYTHQSNLPRMKPGVYMLLVTGGEKPAWDVVNVTNLAVVLKRSPKHALVWVTYFKSGRVVSDASVSFENRRGTVLARSSTNQDGGTLMKLGAGEGTFLIRHGSDLAGIASEQDNPDGRLRAHFQTDRPIYRPGQTVEFKAILRRTLGEGYSVPANAPCTVQLRDPKDNPIDEIHTAASPMGGVAGSFSIPSEAMTGPYSLVLTAGKDTAYQTVTVAEYRKPEFKVDSKPLSRRYLAGEEITFQVDADYYFGAPVPQAQIRYQVRRDGMPFYEEDADSRAFYSGDGNLYPRDTYRSSPFVAEDNVYTDKDGKATIKIKTDPKAPDSSYTLSCTVTDASRRQVEGGTTVPVYAASIRLGLSTKLQYATLGSLLPVQIQSVDLDGKPASPTVYIKVVKMDQDPKTGEAIEVPITTTSVKLPPNGKYTISLPTRKEGELRIYASAKDPTGRMAWSEFSIWVEGNYEKVKEDEEPKVDVKPDRRVYSPGDTANVLATTNKPNAPLLLVVEGGDIWSYKVIQKPKAGQVWKVPATLELSPNAYVTIEQWVNGDLVSGNAILPVPDRSKILKIQVKPDRPVYAPGDKANISIHTEDGHGKPVAAEVAFSVVDEAIYALAGDNTPDPYDTYWGLRPDRVSMTSSAPEELSGGAYQRVNAVAPVRQRFVDTAYWAPIVDTDSAGNATISFETPGNLTSWRATARGITGDTSAGIGTNNFIDTRPVTLRLATPRQLVEGDRIAVIGTIDNRSDANHDFEARLDVAGADEESPHSQTVHIAAKSEGKVQWLIKAQNIPDSGSATLSGQVEATDAPGPENADALRIPLAIVPNGLPYRSLVGGSVESDAHATLDLPADRLEPATVASVTVRAGIQPAMEEAASTVLSNPRDGSVGAANQIDAAVATGLGDSDDHVRESLALLSRIQRPDGWGWWPNSQTDPVLTARVGASLGEARRAHLRVFDNLAKAASQASEDRYNATNLWEHRALLAYADVALEDPKGEDLVSEVAEHGDHMSPYARLRLAEALALLNKSDAAAKLVEGVMADASSGPSETYLPTGDGIGWSASDIQTTAEALYALAKLRSDNETQQKLARWLISPDRSWCSLEDEAAVVRALHAYLQNHPEPQKLGDVKIEVNGTAVKASQSKFGQAVSAEIPRELLKSGQNDIQVHRDGDGTALFVIDATCYRPTTTENVSGVRVLRRYEVQDPAGNWIELNRTVKAGEPVRCTEIAWGDSISDSVRVIEPLPAGFEFVEDAGGGYDGYEEVRDGAVIHYVTNSGTPQTFQYYVRAELDGQLVALPVTAEYLRRPKTRGNSTPIQVTVEGAQ